jgi:outer membrane protein TolC
MKVILAFVISFVCLLSHAQTRLPLEEAINIALKNNFDIQIAKSNLDIDVISNHIGIAGGLPTVSGTASDQESVVNINQRINTSSGINEITKNGASSNTLNANVTGTILLYNGLRVKATKKRLEQLQSQSEQILSAQIQITISSVMIKYYDVVRQGFYLKALQKSIDLSKKQLELIEVKKSVGLANNAELFQSQIDLNTRLQDYLSQELVLHQSTSDLLTLLSIRPDSNLIVQDTIIVDKSMQLDQTLNAVSKNPSVVAADEQIKINALIEKETAAQRYPSLRFNTGINLGRTVSDAGQTLLNQSYGPFAGLSVSVPIYNGSAFKRQEQVAVLNTKIAKTSRESLLLSLQNDAVKTYQSYNNNLSQIEKQQKTFQLSQQLLSLSEQRYQLAQATILEVREAQKSFEDAAYRLINLAYAAKAAEIELKRLENRLGL